MLLYCTYGISPGGNMVNLSALADRSSGCGSSGNSNGTAGNEDVTSSYLNDICLTMLLH